MAGRIAEIERDGEAKTAILIGDDSFGLPRHLMQGEKKSGIIYDGKAFSEWYWEGMCVIDGMRYVYFPPLSIRPIDAIATECRKDALRIVRNIAVALKSADEEFLDLESGIFPLYRIWITGDCGILLLPPDLGDIFSVMMDDKEKERCVSSIIQGNAEKGFLLITEMAELLYYAASGVLPFARDGIRESGYRQVPLSAYAKLPERTDGFISFILNARSREMRDIMGNGKAGECLGWFLSRSASLEWDAEDRTEEERDRAIAAAESSAPFTSFMASRERKAGRRIFWRRRGTVICIAAAAAISIAVFLWSWISGLLEPPLTKDMDPEEIIEAFYDAQSDCRPDLIREAIKGFEAPQEREITTLYVTSRTRMAYEGMETVINVNDWLAAGSPPVPDTSVIYGVVLDSIERTGESEYTAHSTWYTTLASDLSGEAPTAGGTEALYGYSVEQTFSFSWNRRGWWNITGSEITGREYLGYETVSTYSPGREILPDAAAVSGMEEAGSGE